MRAARGPPLFERPRRAEFSSPLAAHQYRPNSGPAPALPPRHPKASKVSSRSLKRGGPRCGQAPNPGPGEVLQPTAPQPIAERASHDQRRAEGSRKDGPWSLTLFGGGRLARELDHAPRKMMNFRALSAFVAPLPRYAAGAGDARRRDLTPLLSEVSAGHAQDRPLGAGEYVPHLSPMRQFDPHRQGRGDDAPGRDSPQTGPRLALGLALAHSPPAVLAGRGCNVPAVNR
jgi:hypothetical protein